MGRREARSEEGEEMTVYSAEELRELGVDVYAEMTELEIVEGVNPADVVAVDDWQLVGATDGDRY